MSIRETAEKLASRIMNDGMIANRQSLINVLESALRDERKRCPKCEGETVQFTGAGRELQYRICEDFEKAGHLTPEEINRRIQERRLREMPRAFPSGRWT